MIFAIDFDGTITTEPAITENELVLREHCKECLQLLHQKGHSLILWTCRTDKHLGDAIRFLMDNDMLKFFSAINSHDLEVIKAYGDNARKIYADVYIDDKNLFTDMHSIWKKLLYEIKGGYYDR